SSIRPASSKTTLAPAEARTCAAVAPPAPEPTTTTSYFSGAMTSPPVVAQLAIIAVEIEKRAPRTAARRHDAAHDDIVGSTGQQGFDRGFEMDDGAFDERHARAPGGPTDPSEAVGAAHRELPRHVLLVGRENTDS